MSLPGIVPEVLAALARASVEGALFVAAVWLLCRLVPRLPAAVRCGLWWAACLKLLLGLAPLPAVQLPLLPAARPAPAVSRPLQIVQGRQPAGCPPATSLPAVLPSGKTPAAPPVPLGTIAAWALAALWLGGLLILFLHALGQLRRTRRIVRAAEPVGEGWVRSAFAEICARLGLRHLPGLRGSAEVRTPQVTGLAAPVVLVPRAGLERLTPAEVSMTLCHELVHLRRKDLWLGWVPALAHRLFFFHPLAALAVREYAVAREAACDAEVLRVLGSAPRAYGRLLLRWGVAPRETGLAVAGASPSLQNLKRRLQMLQQTSQNPDSKRRVSGWWWLAAAAVVVSLVPVSIVAQERAPQAPQPPAAPAAVAAPEPPAAETPEPAEDAPVAAEDPEPEEAPEATPAPPAPDVASAREGAEDEAAMARGAETPDVPAVAPLPPLPVRRARLAALPAPPPPPAAPPAPPKPPKAPNAYGYSYSTSDDEPYVLMYGDNSAAMSGSTGDLGKVKRLRGSSQEDILWFRRGGKEYVVRDPALLKQAKELFKAQGELGARQGELGGRQGALGARQGELGAKQGVVGAEMGTLAADRARRGSDADDRDLDRREKELSTKMEDLGRQQEALGRQQEELGRQQETLGRQQEELGRKAEKELHGLMDRAMQSGAAQEVK